MLIAMSALWIEQQQPALRPLLHHFLNTTLTSNPTYNSIIISSRPRDYVYLQARGHCRIVGIHTDQQTFQSWQQLIFPKLLNRLRPDILHTIADLIPLIWSGPLVFNLLSASCYTYTPCSPSSALTDHWSSYRLALLQYNLRRANIILAPSTVLTSSLATELAVYTARIRTLSEHHPASHLHQIYQQVLQKKPEYHR